MKTETQTPENTGVQTLVKPWGSNEGITPKQELENRIAKLKKDFETGCRVAKLACKFKESDYEGKVRMIKKGGDKDEVSRLSSLFYSLKPNDRKVVFEMLTNKAVITGFVQTGCSLSMSLKLSPEHYNIVLTHPLYKLDYRFPEENTKRTKEQAEQYAKAVFPKITKIEWK